MPKIEALINPEVLANIAGRLKRDGGYTLRTLANGKVPVVDGQGEHIGEAEIHAKEGTVTITFFDGREPATVKHSYDIFLPSIQEEKRKD